jgi:integrase
MAAIKKLLNWALDRGYVEVNPIAGMAAPGKKVARERVLHDHEIQSLMRAAEAEGYPFGTIYLVLLYTAQRRGEVSGMRWSEIDRQRGSWTIPSHRSKNGMAHEVPLPAPVLELLDSVPRFLHSDYVFTTTGASPVSGFGRAKDRIDAQIGAKDWWVHDIRRTAASGMARLGVAPHVIEKVLNHKTGQISGVAAVYNRYGYENEKGAALQFWAKYLGKLAAAPCSQTAAASHSVLDFTQTDRTAGGRKTL